MHYCSKNCWHGISPLNYLKIDACKRSTARPLTKQLQIHLCDLTLGLNVFWRDKFDMVIYNLLLSFTVLELVFGYRGPKISRKTQPWHSITSQSKVWFVLLRWRLICFWRIMIPSSHNWHILLFWISFSLQTSIRKKGFIHIVDFQIIYQHRMTLQLCSVSALLLIHFWWNKYSKYYCSL